MRNPEFDPGELRDPAPPRRLHQNIMAAVNLAAEAQSTAPPTSPISVTAARRTARTRFASLAVLAVPAGMALVWVSWLVSRDDLGLFSALTSPVTRAGLVTVPLNPGSLLLTAVGLALYTSALFATLSSPPHD